MKYAFVVVYNGYDYEQAAPAASVIHPIAVSGIDLPPLLPFLIWATSGDWLEEAGVHGVVLTYRVHLRTP